MKLEAKIIGANFHHRHGDENLNVKLEIMGVCTLEQKNQLVRMMEKEKSVFTSRTTNFVSELEIKITDVED